MAVRAVEYVGEDFSGAMARMAANRDVQARWALTDAMQEPLPEREPVPGRLRMPEIFRQE